MTVNIDDPAIGEDAPEKPDVQVQHFIHMHPLNPPPPPKKRKKCCIYHCSDLATEHEGSEQNKNTKCVKKADMSKLSHSECQQNEYLQLVVGGIWIYGLTKFLFFRIQEERRKKRRKKRKKMIVKILWIGGHVIMKL